jgi:hypothetical protein
MATLRNRVLPEPSGWANAAAIAAIAAIAAVTTSTSSANASGTAITSDPAVATATTRARGFATSH